MGLLLAVADPGHSPGLVRTVAVLVRSGRGVACVFNTNRCGLRFYIKNTISPTISLIIRLIVALIVIYGTMSPAHCSNNEPKCPHCCTMSFCNEQVPNY